MRTLVVMSYKTIIETIISCMDSSLMRDITLKAWRKMVTTPKNWHGLMKIYQWKIFTKIFTTTTDLANA